MTPQQATTHELREYWEYLKALKSGSIIEKYIETSRMPPWEDLCTNLDWDSYRVRGGYVSRKHHGYCGVYRLFGLAVDDDPRRPATLDRLCGKDTTGTLYIGQSSWLNQRLNQLRRSLGWEDTHGAMRMWGDSPVLKSKFPEERLGIALLFTKVGMEKHIEHDLMRAYRNSFGDTPPLNCSY